MRSQRAGRFLGLTCAVVSSACSAGQSPIESATLVLEDCNLITMRSPEVRSGMTVVVDADTIAAIGSDGSFRVPAGTATVDCEGRYVLPGLTDAHVHLGHRTELLSYLIGGVTTVFNLGGDHLDLFSGDRVSVLALRDSVAAGLLTGPTIYSAGQSLDADPATGPFQRPLSSVEEAEAAVFEQFEAGFDFIKVYDALDTTLHSAIIAASGELGMPVFGHIPEAVGVQSTLVSGQAVITHAEEFYPVVESAPDLDGAIRQLALDIRESEIAVIPNGAFIDGLIRQLEDLDRELARPEVNYLAPAVRVWWDPKYNYYVNRDEPQTFLERNRVVSAWIEQLVGELHAHGVLLLAGSDASIPVALPGPALHEELAALVQAGLTPYEALQAATANIEAFMTAHHPRERGFGTIAVGSRADLVILEADPLDSLDNLEAIVGIVLRGEWREAAQLRILRDQETAAWSVAASGSPQ